MTETEETNREGIETREKTATLELNETEIRILEETIPEIVAKERRFEARQMLMKTGRAGVLQSVLGKLDDVEATADEQINADVEVVE